MNHFFPAWISFFFSIPWVTDNGGFRDKVIYNIVKLYNILRTAAGKKMKHTVLYYIRKCCHFHKANGTY